MNLILSLSKNLDEFNSALSGMNFNEETKSALELIWQLNDNEEIQEKAYELLTTVCPQERLDSVEKTFRIFSSVDQVLPWSESEANSIQKENFNCFFARISIYEPFFANGSVYVEKLLNLGRKLYMLFKLDEQAADCFEIIVKNNPDCAEAYYSLGRIAEKKFQFEKALNYFEKTLQLSPDYIFAETEAGFIKGSIFFRWEEAIVHFEKVLANEPYSADSHSKIAEAYYNLDDFGRCRQFVEIALGINEFHEEALNLLGLLQWKAEKNTEAALETFHKGLDHNLHSDSAILLKSLGDIHFEQFQDYEKAKLFYEKSLLVNFAQKKVIKQLVTILLHHFQDLKSVVHCYENYLEQIPYDYEMKTAYAGFLIEYKHDFMNSYNLLLESSKLNENFAETLKLLKRIKDYVSMSDEDLIDESEDDFMGGNASGDSVNFINDNLENNNKTDI
jgi:tetratricopeptide (TPR) repeat protein